MLKHTIILFCLYSRFLLQCLEDLDRNLRKLNSRLFVIRGQPADALPKLFKEWGTTSLTFEEDPEPFGRVRDHNITTLCTELGITVRISFYIYYIFLQLILYLSRLFRKFRTRCTTCNV